MQPISPPPASDRSGFTLIEALVGLVILTVLAVVTSRALFTALQAESAASRLRDSDLLLDRLACRRAVSLPATGAVDRAVWTLEEAQMITGEGTNRCAWSSAALKSVDRPAFRNTAYWRVDQ